ncbi:unnamed protein product [Acidithrix sp. C25]|nr:unnamed protein product [Acidithrix sp. C25]
MITKQNVIEIISSQGTILQNNLDFFQKRFQLFFDVVRFWLFLIF